ncbi:MAG: PLP-dependent aminotransferase family protein [Saprospiraceae bacterium]|nr:PLP-dependent aminotransferase family protein [Saprospiraceae bacterium]
MPTGKQIQFFIFKPYQIIYNDIPLFMTAFLYERIAKTLEQSIRQGTLKEGDKLPSVRNSSKQRGVSPSTIFQAYYLLEAKGLIEARSKSGYYVKFAVQKLSRASSPIERQAQPSPKQLDSAFIIEEMEELRDNSTLIRLSSAYPSPDLLPTAKIQKAIIEATRMNKENLLHYELPQGNKALRSIIGRQLLEWGDYYTPDEMIITTGCMEALNLCLRAVSKPGDIIAMDQLTYFGIAQMVENLGLQVIAIPVHEEFGLDIDFLEKAIQSFPVKVCLSVTNFNNPTGAVIPTEQKKRLVKLLRQHAIPLIEDDIYGDLYFDVTRPSTCKQFDEDGWVMYCSSFSKTLAPGFRVGYCLPGRFLPSVLQQKRIHSISSDSLAQLAVLHFLKKGRYGFYLRKLRTALHKQALQYAQGIRTYFPEEVRFLLPSGGMVLWLSLPQGFDGYQLFREAREHDIGISPGQVFAVEGSYKNYIRLSFSHPFDEKVEAGLKQLGQLAKKLLH